MRYALVLLHRWLGLVAAGFLFLCGITGAVISWDHELDDLLNSHLMEARTTGPAMPLLDLAAQVEARYPQVMVRYLPLALTPGNALTLNVAPRTNPATGRLFEPGFNQVFLDPATGVELGKREWGAVWPVTRENLVSFLYKLHYSLHLPEMWGNDRWGLWLLGFIAILWTLDCFVGACLTLPARRSPMARAADDLAEDAPVPLARTYLQRWMPAWRIRWSGGMYKLNFDLHRAVSLWTWGLLFIIAFTAFSLNLYREVFYPLMTTVSKVTPTPFDRRVATDRHRPVTPAIGFSEVIETARLEAQRRGWSEPAGSLVYWPNFGIYGVQFFAAGADHGVGGVGHKRLYYDGIDGRYLGDRQPWKGTAADIFVQAQFPLHSGRILGLPGRILISIMGIVVAMLSVTGVVIWWRKRRARESQSRRTGNSWLSQSSSSFFSWRSGSSRK